MKRRSSWQLWKELEKLMTALKLLLVVEFMTSEGSLHVLVWFSHSQIVAIIYGLQYLVLFKTMSWQPIIDIYLNILYNNFHN